MLTIFMFLTFLVTSGSLVGFFGVVLGLVISTTTFSYILIFPALLTLRRKYPNVRRPYMVPGDKLGAWICVVLSMFWVTAATVFSLWPGLLTSTWGGDVGDLGRSTFEVYVFVTVAVLMVIAVIFWWVGRSHAIHSGPVEAGMQPAPAAGD